MQQPPTLKLEMLNFIEENLVPRPDNLNDLTTLSQIKKMLEEIIRNRERSLNEEGVDPDDWIDTDDIYRQANIYNDELNKKRLANEQQNIVSTRNASLVFQEGRKTSGSKLPYITIPIQDKIKSYIVTTPENPTDEFKRIRRLGGKVKKSRKSRKSKKSRKNKRKSRKSRK